jgi:TolA-binding protein
MAIAALRMARQHAAYWLGLTHYERRNYPAAIDWFKIRTLEANPDGPWNSGARYNLARCYEAQGDLSAARQIYYADESPQRHGNQIRADLLEETPSK